MKYEFQAEDGETIEREYRMSEAPAFGSKIEIGGKVYERVASVPHVNGDPVKDRYPVVSNSLPRNLKGYEKDAQGRPIIHNKREHDRIHKECGLIRET